MFPALENGEATIRAQTEVAEVGDCMQWIRAVGGVLTGSVFGLSLSHESGDRISYGSGLSL